MPQEKGKHSSALVSFLDCEAETAVCNRSRRFPLIDKILHGSINTCYSLDQKPQEYPQLVASCVQNPTVMLIAGESFPVLQSPAMAPPSTIICSSVALREQRPNTALLFGLNNHEGVVSLHFRNAYELLFGIEILLNSPLEVKLRELPVNFDDCRLSVEDFDAESLRHLPEIHAVFSARMGIWFRRFKLKFDSFTKKLQLGAREAVNFAFDTLCSVALE